MSDTHLGAGSPLATELVRLRIEAARQAWADRIGAERQYIWRELLVEPIDVFVPRWACAWEAVAGEVRRGDIAGAAAALAQVGALIAELQGVWAKWDAASRVWLEEKAEPWNRRYESEQSGVFDLPNPCPAEAGWVGPLWLTRWARYPGGPASLPGRVAAWVRGRTALPLPVYQQARLAVYLLGSLVALTGDGRVSVAHAADIEALLADLPARDRLADVALVLAALVVPDHRLLDRFFLAEPGREVLDLAEAVLGLCTGVTGDELLDECHRRVAARRSSAEDAAGGPSGDSSQPADVHDEAPTPPAAPVRLWKDGNGRCYVEVLRRDGTPIGEGEIPPKAYQTLGFLADKFPEGVFGNPLREALKGDPASSLLAAIKKVPSLRLVIRTPGAGARGRGKGGEYALRWPDDGTA